MPSEDLANDLTLRRVGLHIVSVGGALSLTSGLAHFYYRNLEQLVCSVPGTVGSRGGDRVRYSRERKQDR